MRAAWIIAGAALAGCAAMNDAMTPSVDTVKDDFDGKVIVRQSPVSAASSMSEAFHVLGFEWYEKYPDLIFITVGSAFRNQAIVNVAFNADNSVLERFKTASSFTEFRDSASYRRFEISWTDFVRIAGAAVVKMKVEGINNYTVSSFGVGSRALVNSKFQPFLQQVILQRTRLRHP